MNLRIQKSYRIVTF